MSAALIAKAAALLPASQRADWEKAAAGMSAGAAKRVKANLDMVALVPVWDRLNLLRAYIGGIGYDDRPASNDPFDLEDGDDE